MRFLRVPLALTILGAAAVASPRAAQPPAQPQQPAQPAQAQPPPQGGRGGGGRGGGGRGGVAVMTLHSIWPDGGQIPVRYTQAGTEDSPPLEWTNAPEGVTSFVLIVHDVDAATAPGTDDTLHWMVWNIPGTQTTLAGSLPRGSELANGIRQISATGPNYRGPGAPSAGPAHHYLFELFALDTTINVPAVGAQPAATRAAVIVAMAGHVRGKGVLVGLFKR